MQKLSQKCAEVVKLDKGFPLISVENGPKVRAEFNNFLSKKHAAVSIGDRVRVSVVAEGEACNQPSVILSETTSRSAQSCEVKESLESASTLKVRNLTTGECCETNAPKNTRSSRDPSSPFFCTCVQENSAQDDKRG